MASEEARNAWNRILDAIDAPEGLDDEISIITNEMSVDTVVDDGGYKARYEELRDKYKARFKESVDKTSGEYDVPPVKEETVNEESYSFKDLDFDGSTE